MGLLEMQNVYAEKKMLVFLIIVIFNELASILIFAFGIFSNSTA